MAWATDSEREAEPAGSPAAPVFAVWLDHFKANPARQQQLEAAVDWSASRRVDGGRRRAIARSFQRFELGESGDGSHLLRQAERTGDPDYVAALRLFVEEEQRHSALFGRGLRHLGARSLSAHWSNGAFRAVRQGLGLDTEIALFLIAETVALGYFLALADSDDAVLAGIGRRIATDEIDHVRFQIDRLHFDLHRRPPFERIALACIWAAGAIGASTVFVGGHHGALRACGRSPLSEWAAALSRWIDAARLALRGAPLRPIGPLDRDGSDSRPVGPSGGEADRKR